jgi:hypothetical protein
MAEPIRKPVRPLHRPPLPRHRPRNPLPSASRAALRIAEALPVPPQASPTLLKPPPRIAAVPAQPEELQEAQRPWTGTVTPAREKRLRFGLQIAILLHIAAVLPFLVSAGAAPTLSDAALATTVLLAGAGVLSLGSASRKKEIRD